MRIPLVTRIRFKHAVVFATALFCVQQVEHSNVLFSVLTAAFILISTIAFNVAGGFTYPSGWFIFFNATLTAIVGLTYKALLGEPAQTHLHAPILTMFAYCLGMLLIIFVAAVARKLTPRRGILSQMVSGEDMKKAATGAFILGTIIQIVSFTVQQESGSLLSAIRQINFFTQMGILLGTFYEVKRSNGAKSSNWIVWASGLVLFFGGLVGFSKFGLLVSVATWLAAAIAAGHDFTRKQLVGIAAFFFLFQIYLVPYSQIARNLRSENNTLSQDIRVSAVSLSRIGEVRKEYLQDLQNVPDDESAPHLYDREEGFFDRLNMLSPDDALIAYTAEGNEEGLLPTLWSLSNVVPHFIWKDKPFYYIGNYYAHQIGMISEEDEGTGISFSPVADAYHQASFFGVAILIPPILLFLFIVMDSLSGDIRESPWGLLFCVICAHTAPEGLLGSQIYLPTYVAFGVVVVAILSKYLLPVVSGVLTNSDRTRVRRSIDFSPVITPRSTPRS